MAAKIYPAAQERILDIWDYTERTWDAKQADVYVKGLVDAVEEATDQRHRWRSVMDEKLPSVFFIRYRHHYIFFREITKKTLGVISVLHENMDIPSRLKEDVGKAD